MAKAPKKDSAMPMLMTIVGVIAALFYFMPGAAVIALIGIAPSIVYLFVDSSHHRGVRVRTIFTFNVAGVLPFLTQAAEGLPSAMTMINDGFPLAIMMGAAAVGIVAVKIAPYFALFFVELMQAERARRVVNQQKKLAEIWGRDIIGANSKYFKEVGHLQKETLKK